MIKLEELQVEMDYLKKKAVDGNLNIDIDYHPETQAYRFTTTNAHDFMNKLVKWMKQELELKG